MSSFTPTWISSPPAVCRSRFSSKGWPNRSAAARNRHRSDLRRPLGAGAWSEAAADPAADVYSEGGLFARYLIRTQGIDAFVRYYRQAPGLRDPALFAINFSAFWNMTVDDVWTAMHVVNPGAATTDATICPCSLPASRPTDNRPLHARQPLLDARGDPGRVDRRDGPRQIHIVSTTAKGSPTIPDGQRRIPADTPEIADANVAIVQLADGRSRYLPAPTSQASAGQYLADSCAGTTPYALPADFLSGPGNLWILAGPADADSVTMYLQLQIPAAAKVTTGEGVGICDSCAFDQGSCPDRCPPRWATPRRSRQGRSTSR